MKIIFVLRVSSYRYYEYKSFSAAIITDSNIGGTASSVHGTFLTWNNLFANLALNPASAKAVKGDFIGIRIKICFDFCLALCQLCLFG